MFDMLPVKLKEGQKNSDISMYDSEVIQMEDQSIHNK